MIQNIVALASSTQLASRSNMLRMLSPSDGSIIGIAVIAGAVNGSGPALFDCNINGVSIFADPANRPTIAAGNLIGEVNLAKGAVLVVKYQTITLDLDIAPAGGVIGPLWMLVAVDDSLTHERYIKDLYMGAFNRVATTLETSAAKASLTASSAPLALRGAANALVSALFSAAEYTARARTDDQFVDDLYASVLGRISSLDPGGHAYWLGQLVTQGGTRTRAAMVTLFVLSGESINNRLNQIDPGALAIGDSNFINGVPVKPGAVPSNGQHVTYVGANTQFEFLDPSASALPLGGTVGQILAKLSGADGDGGWIDAPEGGGGGAGGVAHGDLDGSYPSPRVIALAGRPLSSSFGIPPGVPFSDNFTGIDGAAPNAALWVATTGVVGGVGEFIHSNKLRLSTNSGNDASIISAVVYDMSLSESFAQVGPITPNLVSGDTGPAFIVGPPGTVVSIAALKSGSGGDQKIRVREPSGIIFTSTYDYNPAVHVYFRIKNIGASTLSFDYSTNGSDWTSMVTSTYLTTAQLAAAKIKIALAYFTTGLIGSVDFDQFATNVLPPGPLVGGENITYNGATGEWDAVVNTSTLPAGGILGDTLIKNSGADGDASWAAPGAGVDPSPNFNAIADGATVTIATAGAKVTNSKVTLGGNRTLAITGAVNGSTGLLIVKQDGTGGRTLALPALSKVINNGAGVVVLSTGANAIDILAWVYDGTNYFWTLGGNYS